jgi:ABC-type uncharacterized transport system permease subunit
MVQQGQVALLSRRAQPVQLGQMAWAWIGVTPFFVFALMFLIVPTLYLVVGAFQDPAGNFTLANLAQLFTQSSIRSAYWISIKVSLASATFGGLLGFALAYAAVIGGLPQWIRPTLMTFSGVASNFAGLPLAFAFLATLGRTGLVTTLLVTFFDFNIYSTGFNLLSFWGLTLTYLYFQIPLMVLFLRRYRDCLCADRVVAQHRHDPALCADPRRCAARPEPGLCLGARHDPGHRPFQRGLYLVARPQRPVAAMKQAKLGSWIAIIVGSLYFIVPLIGTFEFSMRMRRGEYSFAAYRVVFADPNFQATFAYSTVMALATIVIGVVLVVPTSYWIQLRLQKLRPLVEFITLMPLVIPAIVIVFGYLRLYNSSSILPMTASARSTDLLLAFSYVTLALPYMYRAVDTGMRAIDVRTLTGGGGEFRGRLAHRAVPGDPAQRAGRHPERGLPDLRHRDWGVYDGQPA